MEHTQQANLVSELERIWEELLPTLPRPFTHQFERWARLHGDIAPLRYAFECAARRLARKPFNDAMHPLAFISSVANAAKTAARPAGLPDRVFVPRDGVKAA